MRGEPVDDPWKWVTAPPGRSGLPDTSLAIPVCSRRPAGSSASIGCLLNISNTSSHLAPSSRRSFARWRHWRKNDRSNEDNCVSRRIKVRKQIRDNDVVSSIMFVNIGLIAKLRSCDSTSWKSSRKTDSRSFLGGFDSIENPRRNGTKI